MFFTNLSVDSINILEFDYSQASAMQQETYKDTMIASRRRLQFCVVFRTFQGIDSNLVKARNVRENDILLSLLYKEEAVNF